MAEALKDQFFTRESISHLAKAIKKEYAVFNDKLFLSLVFDEEWTNKELKTRMRHVTQCLHKTLPKEFTESVSILMKIAPEISGFDAMVLPDFVELYGLDHWDLSFQAFEIFTARCSSEFGVRPFIVKDPEKAMKYFYQWAASTNEHVRRLASEGCRPMLPWAMALPVFKKDPTQILPILEKIKDDSSLYVRKSVANNLNDISKNQPDLVLELCEKWKGKSENTDWIIKQACRTLLKAGNPRAMMLFGFANPELFEVHHLKTKSKNISIGESVEFQFELINQADTSQKVRLEYIMHFRIKNGKTSPKVFQISETVMPQGKKLYNKKHAFVEMTTRKLYPGEHYIEIKVNGVVKDKTTFLLLA